MSFPSPIESLILRVTAGISPSVLTFNKTILSANLGSNRIQINGEIKDAFNNQPPGTIFNPSIVTTYNADTLSSDYALSTPSVSNFIPRKIIPTLSLSDIPDKLTTDASFSIASLVSNTGTGVLSYSSSNTSIATVNSSTGVVTVVGAGTATITVSLAASVDQVYAAATPVSKTLTVKITPSLSLSDIPDKLTTDASFSIASLVSNTGTGVLSYSSSNTSIATVNSSTGVVTVVGAGTATITVSLAASVDQVYAAATPVSKTLTVLLPPPLSLLSNGVTIKYNGLSTDVGNTSARFIQANPRGTGMEWFAVVKNGMKNIIINYSISSGWAGSFTPSGESSPVPFNNIVTTLMTNMSSMFSSATAFNQNIASWDTSNVTDMQNMFYSAKAFNQPLNSWNTLNVTNMHGMFYNAWAFNQPINSWDTSKVTNMSYMFYGARAFNQPLNSWNTLNVTNMNGMFMEAYVFNQPLNSWFTFVVMDMNYMFYSARAFNQNISGWEVSFVMAHSNFSVGSALTTNNTPLFFL